MATTYKHPQSKFWFARFTDRNGKRISRSTKVEVGKGRKKDATTIAGKFEADERDARLRSTAPEIARRAVEMASLESQGGTLTLQRAEDLIRQMTAAANPTADEGCFRRFAAAWLDRSEKGVSAQSAESQRYAVKVANKTLGPKADGPLRRITQDDIAAVQAAFAAGRAGGRTVNMNLIVVRRIFADAVKRAVLDRSPCDNITSVSTADSSPRLPFTIEEVRRLITAAPSDEWKGLITLASQTGLRCGDLRGLTSANIKGTWITTQPNKTRKSSGKIVKSPLTPPCMKWLDGRADGAIFPELAGLHKQRVAETFDGIMAKAQVEKVIVLAPGDPPKIGRRSFHSLRHSFTSWLAQSDVHADVRMKLTGHTSAAVHAAYTDHGDALQRAVGVLPDL